MGASLYSVAVFLYVYDCFEVATALAAEPCFYGTGDGQLLTRTKKRAPHTADGFTRQLSPVALDTRCQ